MLATWGRGGGAAGLVDQQTPCGCRWSPPRRTVVVVVDVGRPAPPMREQRSQSGVESASDTARRLLWGLADRWRHTQGVVARAESVAAAAELDDKEFLVAAAWLHDVGYSPRLIDTGFHPLDAARWLAGRGMDRSLVGLVAHHSCACFEAVERGLDAELNRFERVEGVLADALTYADMTTSPTGEGVSVEDRIAEVRSRYSANDPVHRAVTRARPEILAAVRRTEERVGQRGAGRLVC